MVLPDLRDYRNAILRCYWDGAAEPSVEVPLGDFFALTNGRVRQITSVMVTVNPGFGSTHGLNAYFPMPFALNARITLENRGPNMLGGVLGAVWYHIDYEAYPQPLGEDVDCFHACYRQERPTTAVGDTLNTTMHNAVNLDGRENYVALDTEGAGRMAGLVLAIENLAGDTWYGEGDDMVFIDGEQWPPSIHGTGTEEIFGGGACPTSEYAGPYTGFHMLAMRGFDGLVGMYRWYVHDPIHFSTSLRWTLEHGHANNFANNYSSVAYWYQSPRVALPALPSAQALLPPLGDAYDKAWSALTQAAREAMAAAPLDGRMTSDSRLVQICAASESLYKGDFAVAADAINRVTG
jgi:hypothetical protein